MQKTVLLVLASAICVALIWFSGVFRRDPALLGFWSLSSSKTGTTIVTGGGKNSPQVQPQQGQVILWNLEKKSKKLHIELKSSVRSVAWSPDEKFIVTGDFAGSTLLLDPITGKTLANLPPHSGGTAGGINSVAISGDSQLVASGSFDGTVSLWDMKSGELPLFILPANEKVFSIALSPTATRRMLMCGGQTGKAYLASLDYRASFRTLTAIEPPNHKARVETVAFSHKGDKVLTGCLGMIRIWNSSSGQLLCTVTDPDGKIRNAVFSPEGDTVASVDDRGRLVIWNSQNGASIKSAQAHDCAIFALAFSGDGRRIATAGREDYKLRLWDAKTLARLITIEASR